MDGSSSTPVLRHQRRCWPSVPTWSPSSPTPPTRRSVSPSAPPTWGTTPTTCGTTSSWPTSSWWPWSRSSSCQSPTRCSTGRSGGVGASSWGEVCGETNGIKALPWSWSGLSSCSLSATPSGSSSTCMRYYVLLSSEGKYITGCPRFITFFSLEKFISTGRSGKLSYPRPRGFYWQDDTQVFRDVGFLPSLSCSELECQYHHLLLEGQEVQGASLKAFPSGVSGATSHY